MRDDEVLRRLRAKLTGMGARAPGRRVVNLKAGPKRLPITAEVASTPDEVRTGLSGRESLPWGHGMIFVFPDHALHRFWMRDTIIPLSIAFLRDDGTVVDLQDMTPLTDDLHPSASPVRLALEMGRGWFVANGIGPGDRISGVAELVG